VTIYRRYSYRVNINLIHVRKNKKKPFYRKSKNVCKHWSGRRKKRDPFSVDVLTKSIPLGCSFFHIDQILVVTYRNLNAKFITVLSVTLLFLCFVSCCAGLLSRCNW